MARSVLLIDPDAGFERQLARELAPLGLSVASPPPGHDALSAIGTTTPAAVVIAVDEPDKVGFLLCNRAKKGAAAGIPVVMVTKSVSADDFAAHQKLKVHADDYIDKRRIQDGELASRFRALLDVSMRSRPDIALPIDVMEEAEFSEVSEEIIVESGEFEAINEFDLESNTSYSAPTSGPSNTEQSEEDRAFDALGAFDDAASEFAPPTPTAFDGAGIPASIDAQDHGAPSASNAPEARGGNARAAQSLPPPASTVVPTFGDEIDFGEEPVEEVALAPDATVVYAASVMAPPAGDDFAPPTVQPLRVSSPALPSLPSLPSQPTTRAARLGTAQPLSAHVEQSPTATSEFDLGLDEVAAWAQEEKSKISDRRALQRLTDLEQENERLRQELAASQGANAAASRDDMLSLREQVAAKDLALGHAQAEVSKLTARLAEFESARQNHASATADLQAEFQARLAGLEAAKTEAQTRATASEARAEAVESRLAEVQKALAAASTELEQEREKTKLTLRGEENAQQARELAHQEELERVRAEAAAAREQALTEAREQYQAALAVALDDKERELGNEVATLRKSLEELQQQRAASAAALAQATASLTDAERAREEAEAALTAATFERDEAQTALEAATRARRDAEEALSAGHQDKTGRHDGDERWVEELKAVREQLAEERSRSQRAQRALAVALTILDEQDPAHE